MTWITQFLHSHRIYQRVTLSANKRLFFAFCIVSTTVIVYYFIHNGIYTSQQIIHSPLLSTQLPSEEKTNRSHTIATPCIEPNCDIECFVTYDGAEINGIIHSHSLTKNQEQHLMIDMGNDSLVNELINFIPPVKICSDHTQRDRSSQNNTNNDLEYYPLSFGFVERYLYATISRQVSINNQIYTVQQMCLPKKSIDFSELIPGQQHTYRFIFENEHDYRRLYRIAYFAVTMKKAGWDCNRHYEIISAGTIPYFDNLIAAGKHTMALLPKSLLYDAQKLPGVNRKNMSIDHSLFDINQYYLLLHRLLYYAKYRLTTRKLVEYILKVIKYPLNSTERHSVLFVSHRTCDFMKDFMLDGFTRIFGENLHVFQPPKFLYDYPDSKRWSPEDTAAYFNERLYGSGFGFKLSLRKYYHLYLRDQKELPNETIMQQWIESKNLTLIVYGSIMRASNLLSLVTKHYERSRIVIIDGQDEGHMNGRIDFAKKGYYFCREIPDDCRDKFI